MISEALLPELDQEMKLTHAVLQRCAEERFHFSPHPKSWTLGRLANHVASIPEWGSLILEEESFNVADPANQEEQKRREAKTMAQLLQRFEAAVLKTREAITATTDAEFLMPWSLKHGDHTIFTMPRVAVLRSLTMNHLYHHRGQLTVYLRMNDIPVPAIYGPSADES